MVPTFYNFMFEMSMLEYLNIKYTYLLQTLLDKCYLENTVFFKASLKTKDFCLAI